VGETRGILIRDFGGGGVKEKPLYKYRKDQGIYGDRFVVSSGGGIETSPGGSASQCGSIWGLETDLHLIKNNRN